MYSTLLTSQYQPKRICIKCNQEIEGTICWKSFKWAAIRCFILTLLFIPSLHLLQYQIGIFFVTLIGIFTLFFFLVMLCSCHSQTTGILFKGGGSQELRDISEIYMPQYEIRQEVTNQESNTQSYD